LQRLDHPGAVLGGANRQQPLLSGDVLLSEGGGPWRRRSGRNVCDGPYGAVALSEYTIDMADFRESVARHDGPFDDLAQEIAAPTKKLPERSNHFVFGPTANGTARGGMTRG
jgi:hypothetical protein